MAILPHVAWHICYAFAMSRVSQLRTAVDPIKAAEQEHDGSKVSLRLSPLTTFILDAGLQPRLTGSRTRVATQLAEAAALDWLEGQGIDPDSEDFKKKYLQWLTRQPLADQEAAALGLDPDDGPYYEAISL